MKPVRLGNTANAGCCKGGTDGLLGHHGQFTRLGLRACERQPWLEERVGHATQPCSHFNQLIRDGSSSERVGVY